jgi:hypothetical protein
MDFQKSKLFLDKLNREFARLSKDPDNVVRLDIDIMASYVRDLYDALYDSPVAPAPVAVKPEPAPRREPVPEPAPPPVKEPEIIAVIPEIPESKPVKEKKEASVPHSAPIVSTAYTSEKMEVMDHETEALFEEKVAKELSDRLSELPIADLKKAIALNDKLLYTRELFGGQGTAFDTSISEINGMGNFADAQNYMVKQCVKRFEWNDPKRIEIAKGFIRLVRRRFK